MFLVTPLDPIFVILPSLLNSQSQQTNRNLSPVKASRQSDQYENFEQIVTSIQIQNDSEQDPEVIEIDATPCSVESMGQQNGTVNG